MDIKTVAIDSINPAPYNPRKALKPGDPDYEKLKKSILEFDLVSPLVWNAQTLNLISGHQRLQVLRDLGATEVQVAIIDLDPDKEKALNLALNKIAGEWDIGLLRDVLADLDEKLEDIEITGFNENELAALFLHIPDEEPEFDEGIADDVSMLFCPECGHEFPA